MAADDGEPRTLAPNGKWQRQNLPTEDPTSRQTEARHLPVTLSRYRRYPCRAYVHAALGLKAAACGADLGGVMLATAISDWALCEGVCMLRGVVHKVYKCMLIVFGSCKRESVL